MLRKSILAVAATAVLAAAALAIAPAPASAKGKGGGEHHHHHHGSYFRVFSPPVYAGYDACMSKRWVITPSGKRLRWVNVCAL